MKNKFILPDFTKSNLNISATLAEFLGCENNKPTLPILKKELEKNYKNIVFICFDGLGNFPMQKNLKSNDFLMTHIKQTLVSTFPSTTTNATNSLLRNEYPLEHGWLGWSLYFENINRCVDIFRDCDSLTKEQLNIENPPIIWKKYYFDDAKSDYQINSVFPSFVRVEKPENNRIYKNNREFFKNLKQICEKDGKQFCYAYNNEPDHTMHDYGVTSKKAKKLIKYFSRQIKKLWKKTKDTLFVITADHGQVDIKGYVEIFKDQEIMDMLEIYPYLDSRAAAFKLKKGFDEQFVKLFNERYSEDFELVSSKELVEKGFFGTGDKAHLLGDYIAIGTYTHKQMVLTPNSVYFKGHHTSLTEEMEVPLILISNKEDSNE